MIANIYQNKNKKEKKTVRTQSTKESNKVKHTASLIFEVQTQS